MGCYCLADFLSYCLVCNEKMADELCLQDRTKLVDFWLCRFNCIWNSFINSQLAKLESSNEKPGGGTQI